MQLPTDVILASAPNRFEVTEFKTDVLETRRNLDLFHQFLIAAAQEENVSAKNATVL